MHPIAGLALAVTIMLALFSGLAVVAASQEHADLTLAKQHLQ